MSDDTSPSPIISYFVDQIGPHLPEADRAVLATYADQVASTTHHGDFRRAHRCAEWAVSLADGPDGSGHAHLLHEIGERHRLLKDTIFGVEFGIMLRDGVGPGQDAEIQWVDDAVAIATSVAGTSGWTTVGWERVLKDMLSIAGPEQ